MDILNTNIIIVKAETNKAHITLQLTNGILNNGNGSHDSD